MSKRTGIAEPLQTKDSLQGQVNELNAQLAAHTDPPIILIGSSWGSVLALFVAAERREAIAKLILIGSAVFDAESSLSIEEKRLRRLTDEQRLRCEQVQDRLKRATGDERHTLFREWGDLMSGTDTYDPLTRDMETIEVRADIFESVWADFVALRDTPGRLRKTFSNITAPAVVIHGDYDPHPIEGIAPFLTDCLPRVQFHILPRCGHYPWIEKHARRRFFDILFEEIDL